MQKVQFGNTGFEVSRLGVGLSEIGSLELSDQDQAMNVLNTALDNGINFLDTSACYGISEELVGNGVSQRRDDYFLATKAGHVALGYEGEAWTYQTVADSIDRSLRLLQTDHVDVVQLHSCDIDVLEKGDVIRALQEAQQAGKTRFIGYSGDNEAAHWAVDSGLFATLQTSYNLVE
ncbi:aldo/keto reductase, partial [SAR202 cluster bacterium AD-812-D07_MRT_10900m]|nr:aldo/keto reductase [SAR202 cluster bacterium AD-812-D07_MRT_10900m]